MSPNCEFYDEEGIRVQGSQTIPADLFEGFHQPPEYHYRQSDLTPVDNVDLALTYELIGTGESSHELLVSSSFYRFCRSEGLELYWFPVAVEPD